MNIEDQIINRLKRTDFEQMKIIINNFIMGGALLDNITYEVEIKKLYLQHGWDREKFLELQYIKKG
jgi:hypothetical protein